MSNIFNCIMGPRLYNGPLSSGNQVADYSANMLESIPQFVISSTKLILGIFKWTAIFWMPFIYRKYKATDNIMSVSKLLIYAATSYWALFALRGVGRMINPMYSDFMMVLQKAQQAATSDNIELLSQYHFDFSYWPVQFDASESKRKKVNKFVQKRSMKLPIIFKPICYILAHTIGIRMAFPGCTSLINTMVAGQRRDRLIQLMKTENVKRVKIRAADSNEIEAFYKDNRRSSDANGQIMVICCEGNAGYPEMGNPKIALSKKYSVIGWNHPGFGGSTGMPFPRAEQYAIDAVMQFALEYLNFDLNHIILFGWSIGGYTATWAAMNYPKVRSLVLDATFDNIDKLAERSLPLILYPLVLSTVYEYIDLNVGQQLRNYKGPIQFIIRGQDEIITTEQGVKTSNRGYHLFMDLLEHRYPNLMSQYSKEELWIFLENSKLEARIKVQTSVNKDSCEKLLKEALQKKRQMNKDESYPLIFPENLSEDLRVQLLIYLAWRYTREFESTHCAELPPKYLSEGWSEASLFQANPLIEGLGNDCSNTSNVCVESNKFDMFNMKGEDEDVNDWKEESDHT